MLTLKEKAKYLNKIDKEDIFKVFTNTESFPQLNEETREVLRTIGLINNKFGTPGIIVDGKLKKYNDTLIQVAVFRTINYPYCININTNEFVVVNLDNNTISIVNSSIKKFIETQYILQKFINEFVVKEKLGEYWSNNKKYANKLQELFEEVEPNIMQYTWFSQVEERYNGVL